MTAPTSPAVTVSLGLEVPAPGGQRLRTDVQRPSGGGRVPAVLLRTPYGTGSTSMLRLGRRLAALGWAAVFQNVRGRYGSEGSFTPFEDEPADGDAALRWLVRQPWSDGRVVLLGISYSTFTAAAVVGGDHDARLLGLVSLVPMTSPRRHFYDGGAFRLHWALGWAQLIHGRRQRPLDVDAMVRHREAPLERLPELLGFPHRPWLDWLADDEAYWRRHDMTPRLLEQPLPGLHVGGWQDFSLGSTFELYRQAATGDEPQQLVIGPWDHNAVLDHLLRGLLDPGAPEAARRLAATFLRFLGARRGEAPSSPSATGPAVQLWRGGDGVFQDLDSWPPPGRAERFWLRPSGSGEAVLDPNPPPSTESDAGPDVHELRLDACEAGPREKAFVPAVGGRLWHADGWSLPGAPSRPADEPWPGWVAEGAPLPHRLDLAGRCRLQIDLQVDLQIDSRPGRRGEPSLPADLHATLWDVDPGQRARWIGEAVRRVKASSGVVVLDFGDILHRLEPRHRLRLELCDSRFPAFDRAPGRACWRLSATGSTLELTLQSRPSRPSRPSGDAEAPPPRTPRSRNPSSRRTPC